MTDVDRRVVLRYLGFGCAMTPILSAKALPWQDVVKAADPEMDALVQEAVGNALRIKHDLSSGGPGITPGDLYIAAGHLRLLDAMMETRGWKRKLREARVPDLAELDRASGDISAGLAESLTTAGFPTKRDEPLQAYLKNRDRFSERDKVQIQQLLRNGSFLHMQAKGLDALAAKLRNQDVDISPVGLIGRPNRSWATGNIQLVAQTQTVPGPGPYDTVSFCQGLQNMAFILSLTAFALSFIPPLAVIALIDEILSLILEIVAFFACGS